MSKRILTGEISEWEFQVLGLRKGLNISLPAITCRYDRVVDCNQKKHQSTNKHTRYEVWLHKTNPYKPNEVDVFAIHLQDINKWYLIPAFLLVGKRSLSIYPDSPKSKFEIYADNWEIFSSSLSTFL
jgi:hypothetical protein